MNVIIEINGRRRRLAPSTTGGNWSRVIAPERQAHGPYILAELLIVHRHGCAAARHSSRLHGPCNCGGQQLLDRLITQKKVVAPVTRNRRWSTQKK